VKKAKDPATASGRSATFTNYTAEPLAHIFEAVRHSPRTILIKFYRDNNNSTLYLDMPSRDNQKAHPPS
jgi:hypothetical protein